MSGFSGSAVTSAHANAVDNLGNFGSIYGLVSLGGGDDSYKGGGVLVGKLFCDDGKDEAIGGSITDWFEGGNQNDILTGNGGGDTLKGDAHLVGHREDVGLERGREGGDDGVHAENHQHAKHDGERGEGGAQLAPSEIARGEQKVDHGHACFLERSGLACGARG